MRILLVGNFLFDKYGGAKTIVNYLKRGYEKEGYEVCSYSFPNLNSRLSRVFSQFLDIFNPWGLLELKKIIKEIKPDIVHLHNIHKDISAYAVRVIKNKNIPVIVTFHDFWALCPGFNLENDEKGKIKCRKPISKFEIPLFFRKTLIKKLISLADYVFLPSNFARKQFLANGYPEQKIKTIYNGIDLEKFKPALSKNKNFVKILFVGRPTKKKGLEWLKEIVDDLKRKNMQVELEVIGGEKKVPYDELPFYYQKADILVQPSLVHETFGLTVAEAMASGLPVIISKMGGMPEIVKNIGIIVEADNKKQLKIALKDIILNREKRIDLGKKGRRIIEENFNYQRMCKEYIEYIKTLC